jgi:hypothetical protein
MKKLFQMMNSGFAIRKFLRGRDFIDRLIVSTAALMLLVSFLFMISGCQYYKISTRTNYKSNAFLDVILNDVYPVKKYPREHYPSENLVQILFQEKVVYVTDSYAKWKLSNAELIGDTIIAEKKVTIRDFNLDKYGNKRYSPSKEPEITKRIVFYSDTLSTTSDGKAYIPVSSLTRCDVYKKAPGKTAGVVIGSIFATIGITLGVIFIIAALTSCPFVYAFDGNNWQFTGEIYGGAVYPSLERHDYLEMPKFNQQAGSEYRIKIANMLQEIQYINMAELMVLTHDSTTDACVDKYGNVQTILHPVLPVSASDSKGHDCLDKLTARDKVIHSFNEALDTSMSGNRLNSLELYFISDTIPETGKLVISGKNSQWGDYMVREFFSLFGRRYQEFVRQQEGLPAGFHLEWMQEQGLPLMVYVMKDNEWQMADYFNLVGALSDRDMVLPLDLSGAWTPQGPESTTGYSLNLKLATGYMFWEIDYAVLDFTENSSTNAFMLAPDEAVDHHGKNIGDLLAEDDNLYLVQHATGDEAVLSFTIPESIGNSYSLFLHSKGYYKQAGELKTRPEIALLETFREPGRLSLWSYQRMEEVKSMADPEGIVYIPVNIPGR